MKKRILTLAVLASMSSMAAVAAEEKAEIDMSDPTDVYTTLGLGYGNKGLDFSSMLLLSSTETQKSGIIFDVKDMLDEQDHEKHAFNDTHTHGTTYRLRWGTINTQNGLGLTLDAVNLDHKAWGRMTVAQFGALATLPIGDDFIMFPIAFVGGVLVEDNTLDLVDTAINGVASDAEKAQAAQLVNAKKGLMESGMTEDQANAALKAGQPGLTDDMIEKAELINTVVTARPMLNATSDGMSMASTIATGMVYARYAITDKLWALGSYSYTKELQGKSWEDGVKEGGLQMPTQQYDITIGYQLTDRQNITAYYGSDDSSDTDDKWKVSYNYAF